jgi:hypothetical protein
MLIAPSSASTVTLSGSGTFGDTTVGASRFLAFSTGFTAAQPNDTGFRQFSISSVNPADAALFSFAFNPCVGSIGSVSSCTFVVKFTPLTAGAVSALLDVSVIDRDVTGSIIVDTPFFDIALSGNGVIASAVPEPSTWAMMILGFCSLGFMAYRRRAKPALMAA